MKIVCELNWKNSWRHKTNFFISFRNITMITTSSIFNIFLTNLIVSTRFWIVNVEFCNRMLIVNRMILIKFQKKTFLKHIFMTISENWFETTNKHCLKSSQKQTIFFFKNHVVERITNIKQNTIDNYYMIFTLHENVVSKYQINFLNKNN